MDKKRKIILCREKYKMDVFTCDIACFFSVNENFFRIYFSTRNEEGKSYPAYAVFERNSWELIELCSEPLLEWGRPGTFDDSGIMFSSLVRNGENIYAYYIGWNQCFPVSYHLSIGLAVSSDGGRTFEKYSDGPLLDRSLEEPIFNTAPCVLLDSDMWEMWYVSCSHWIQGEGKMEPVYNVQYASSFDGVHWKKDKAKSCISCRQDEAIGRPWVIKENNMYKMWYSYRKTLDYRVNKENSYKIGYAESVNGRDWERKDEMAQIDLSETGWDSQMLCYNSVFQENGKLYMLYNGNLFGKTGFGVAKWEELQK